MGGVPSAQLIFTQWPARCISQPVTVNASAAASRCLRSWMSTCARDTCAGSLLGTPDRSFASTLGVRFQRPFRSLRHPTSSPCVAFLQAAVPLMCLHLPCRRFCKHSRQASCDDRGPVYVIEQRLQCSPLFKIHFSFFEYFILLNPMYGVL